MSALLDRVSTTPVAKPAGRPARASTSRGAPVANPPRSPRRSWWGDRSVTVKILTAVAVPVIGAAVIGITGLTALSTASADTHAMYDNNLRGAVTLATMRNQFNQMRSTGVDAALSATPQQAEQYLAEFDRSSTGFDDAAADYRQLDLSADQQQMLDAAIATVAQFRQVATDVLAPLARAGSLDEWVAQRDAQLTPLVTKAAEQLGQLFDADEAGATQDLADIDASASTAQITTIITIAVALLVSLGLGFVIARGIAAATRTVLDVAHRLATGDLTGATGLATRDEMGRMGAALDQATDALRTVMSTVVSGADAVAASSEELSASSTQISAAAEETSAQAGVVAAASEQVSSNVQTVSAAAEQMAASISEIAANAAEAATVAGRAVDAAKSTGSVMRKLDESSAEIGNVISLITSIADQTNLLALNATIEAARAGESGKGFAVVANEVKELAQESAKAAAEISRLVEGIQHDTTDAVHAIDEISQVIMQISDRQATIASAVEEQTATTSEITRSVTEAATGSGEIAANITGVSTAADSTTEALGQSSAAIGELSRMAAELRATVSTFTY